MQSLFHMYLSGFRKRHGCHDILIRLTEDWRQALDNGNTIGVVAIDLSKAFETLEKAKLETKSFSTQCSMVFNPVEGVMYFSLKRDFNKIWKVNLKERTLETYKGFKVVKKMPLDDSGILGSELLASWK